MSVVIPIFLIIALIFFAGFLAYGLWRLAGRGAVCGSCGANALIPPTSPVALQMISKIRDDLSQTRK